MSISIRRASVQDAAAYARIMGDPQVYPGLMQMPYASDEMWRQRLADSGAAGKTDLMLVADLDGTVVGSGSLFATGVNVRRRHAMMLALAVLPEAQGRGVGTALMAALCDYADNWAGVTRIELGVYTDNAPAIGLYKKFGFELEGTARGYALRNGQYVDSHYMARFHPAPPQVPKPSGNQT